MHKDLLCYYSSFFRDHFAVKREAIQQHTMYLPDDSAEDFTFIIDYIYRATPVTFPPGENVMARCTNIIKLAKKVDIVESVDALCPVLKNNFESFKTPPCLLEADFIELVYNVTPKGCMIRLTVAQRAVFEFSKPRESRFNQLIQENDEFAADVFRKAREGGGWISFQF